MTLRHYRKIKNLEMLLITIIYIYIFVCMNIIFIFYFEREEKKSLINDRIPMEKVYMLYMYR